MKRLIRFLSWLKDFLNMGLVIANAHFCLFRNPNFRKVWKVDETTSEFSNISFRENCEEATRLNDWYGEDLNCSKPIN